MESTNRSIEWPDSSYNFPIEKYEVGWLLNPKDLPENNSDRKVFWDSIRIFHRSGHWLRIQYRYLDDLIQDLERIKLSRLSFGPCPLLPEKEAPRGRSRKVKTPESSNR